MQEYKIIFTGSWGAGKTTAIGALSEIGVINTDVINTDRESHSKEFTTVGIDYGQISLPPDAKVGLYGTPGQERFSYIWKVVAKGAIGAIVLIDSTGERALEEVSRYIDFFVDHGVDNVVVGLTHADQEGAHGQQDFLDYIADKRYPYPLFTVDARKPSDVLLLVETLVASAEASILKQGELS